MKRISAMPVEDFSISSIPDGRYTGGFTSGNFTYTVRAYVSDGRLDKVKVMNNRTTSRAKEAETVFRRVIEQQKVNVEPIAGAEGESKALLKALEKALYKGTSEIFE
jgi:uncharacterized protein with FMN-binding domain